MPQLTDTLCWNCSASYPMQEAKCPKCGMTNANCDHDAAAADLHRVNVHDDLVAALRACEESLSTELASVYCRHDALVTRHLRNAIDIARAALAKVEA